MEKSMKRGERRAATRAVAAGRHAEWATWYGRDSRRPFGAARDRSLFACRCSTHDGKGFCAANTVKDHPPLIERRNVRRIIADLLAD